MARSIPEDLAFVVRLVWAGVSDRLGEAVIAGGVAKGSRRNNLCRRNNLRRFMGQATDGADAVATT